MSGNSRAQRRRSGSTTQDLGHGHEQGVWGSCSAAEPTSGSEQQQNKSAEDEVLSVTSNQEATGQSRRGKLKKSDNDTVEDIPGNHSAGHGAPSEILSSADSGVPIVVGQQQDSFNGDTRANESVASGSGIKFSHQTSLPLGRSISGQSTAAATATTSATASIATAKATGINEIIDSPETNPPHFEASHARFSHQPIPQSLSLPSSLSRFDEPSSPHAASIVHEAENASLIPHQLPSPSGRSGTRRSRRSSHTTTANISATDPKGKSSSTRRRRRSSPLRSLTPSRSASNLAAVSAAQDSASGAPPSQIPCSSSSSSSLSSLASSLHPTSLTASHSFPFLAEPPPERPSIRQRRRLSSSMPTRVSSRRKLSRSRSPPTITDRAVSASSAGKRSREEGSSSSEGRHLSTGKQEGSSKRVASGTHSNTPRGAAETKSGSDEEDTTTSSAAAMDPNGRRYELIVIQQPQRGCAFGSNLLSRLPVAPPLIVQLRVVDNQGNELSSDAEEPFLVCHATLLTAEGQNADLISPVQPGQSGPSTPAGGGSPSTSSNPLGLRRSSRRSSGAGSAMSSGSSTSGRGVAAAVVAASSSSPAIQRVPSTPVRMLYGSLAATPQKFTPPPPAGSPTAATEGDSSSSPLKTYFIFPEICVRAKGLFQLKLSLMKLPRPAHPQGELETAAGSDLLATTMTATFEVFLAHQYTVPYVTDLTRFFARQGAALPLPSGD